MSQILKAENSIKKALSKECVCYVLITCTQPDADGEMNVEMHYEGDESLAGFLIENAGQVFEDKMNRRETQ